MRSEYQMASDQGKETQEDFQENGSAVQPYFVWKVWDLEIILRLLAVGLLCLDECPYSNSKLCEDLSNDKSNGARKYK